MLLPDDTPQRLQSYLATMQVIRIFEQTVEQLFSEGRIGGTAHPATGQEAVAVGVCAALTPADTITSTHRGHGHFLARGAELFGCDSGYSHGRGGSQMMADYAAGFIGANGITGGSLPIATGLALNAQLTDSPSVSVCFFGDGASNQGTFHESLNLAALWRLPVIFVCENNGYAMSTPTSAALATPEIATRAPAYGIAGTTVDGNDLLSVREATREAHTRARQGFGPTLLECRTYRLSGHSKGDRREYRSRDEEQNAWSGEPITRFERLLTDHDLLTPQRANEIRELAEQRIQAAITFAEESPLPDPSTAIQGVFA